MPAFLRPLSYNMLDADGADHDRLRNLVHKVFTPKLIETLRTKIEAIANRLIDHIKDAGTVDLVHDFALQLPATVIANMLGVPATDNDQFSIWSQKMTGSTSNVEQLLTMPYMWGFIRYVRRMVAARRAEPRDDLISALVQASDVNDSLTDDEVLAMVVLLLVAGHETSASLIATGTLALLLDPDQRHDLQQHPEIIKTAVEEITRYATPVINSTERYAREDVVIHDVCIPKGAFAIAALGSANHDETQFVKPDALNLRRTDNRHLAFGQGMHYCLGAPLARMELQIAFHFLLERLPNLRLAVAADKVRWRKSNFIRGLRSLPVRV